MDNAEVKDSQYQKDLFSEIIHDADGREPFGGTAAKGRKGMTINIDKILLFLLTCAIIFAVVFSYGIETGKRLQGEESKTNPNEVILSLTPEPLKAEGGKVAKTPEKATTTATTIPLNPPVEAKAPVATKPAAASPFYWTVQIITYINNADANEEVRKFEKLGFESFIIPSGKYLQVCIGRFNSKAEAAPVLEKFKKQRDYSDSYIRKVKRKP